MSRRAPHLSLIVLPAAALAVLILFELGNWDKVSPGVTAVGTQVGGMSRNEAVARLRPSVQRLLDRPLDITAVDAGQTWHTTARELGLRLDPDELVNAAYEVGRVGGPFDRLGDQFEALLHGRSVSMASTTDAAALDSALSRMAQQVDRPPVDAKLALSKDGAIQSSGAQLGLAVDVGASRDQLSAALNGSGAAVALVTRAIPPRIPDEQLQTARDQLQHLLGPDAAALTVTSPDGVNSWRLEHADVAKLVSLSGGTQPGQPAVVKLDDKPLQTWAAKLAKEVDQAVQDARFAFNGGNLKVLRPSKQGRTVDQDALVHTVHDALLNGTPSVALPVATVEPSVSSDDPQSLGIVELIDRGSTSFAGSVPEKKHNIQLAAQRLNGVVVPPGATFSFNEAVGPTTIDAGFQWGFGITSGNDGPRTVPSVAGGICQVATTLFQPVFWSGYQLEQRFWHMYWIPAYTSRGVVGLDVTVDGDAGLDFKWTNTTSTYILIQSDSDDANVYFGLYGKKPPWKVTVDDTVISNRVPPDPKPLAEVEPTLAWGRTLVVETARDGFDAEVIRHVIPADGGKPRDLYLKSSYQPARTITLVGSAGKPANANLDEALQRALDAQKPAEAKPSPTASAEGTPGSNGTPASNGAPIAPTAQTLPTPGVPSNKPPATAIPPARTQQQAPTPTPKAQSANKPAAANGIAPTATPSH